MLFWIMFIILAVGIVGIALTNHKYSLINLNGASIFVAVLSGMATFAMLLVLIFNYINVDGQIAANEKKYESLVYQYENNVYENDNDVGKRELMVDIEEWNTDLARNRERQDDFWIGIFVPDIYDQFEFIEYK